MCNCDLVNETPILDLKPYIPEYDAPRDGSEVRIADWLEQKEDKSEVVGVGFTPRALESIDELWSNHIAGFESKEAFKKALVEVLRNDPRSIYRKGQQKRGENRLFFLNFGNLTITVWFDQDFAEILKLEPFYEHKV